MDSIAIALYSGTLGELRGRTKSTQVHGTWDDLIALLSHFEEARCEYPCRKGKNCHEKLGDAWSPVVIDGDRANENVKAITVAVLDLDHVTDDQLAEVAQKLDGYRYIAHSTHSHHPPEDNCLRIVIPLTREVRAIEWRKVLAATVEVLGIPADPTCKDLSRFYFLPRAPKNAPRLFELAEGKALNVDDLLRHANQAKPLPPRTEKDGPPLVVDGDKADLSALLKVIRTAARSKMSTRPKDEQAHTRDREHYRILEAIADGEPFAEPGNRDNTFNTAMSLIANAVNPLTPFEVLEPILRRCIVPIAEPEGVDHWLKEARDMYARALERRAEFETDLKLRTERTKAGFEALLRKRAHERETDAEESPEPGHERGKPAMLSPPSPGIGEDPGSNWTDLLQPGPQGGWRSSGYNAYVILTYDEAIKGSLRWNEVTKAIEVHGGIMKGTPPSVLDTAIADWLQVQWGITLSTHDVGNRILRVAMDNAYDPVRDYLRGLEWDGVERIDTWLIDYAHALTVNEEGTDISDLIKKFGARFLVAAVARGLNPGEKVDTVLILEGAQGLKKSSLFRVLGGAWFADDKITLGDKDSKLLAARTWIAELAELTSLRRGDVEQQKQFISQVMDTFRPPYGRTMEQFPRRCVFTGTVNPNELSAYLSDTTGNRRWWCVRCDDTDAFVDADLEGLTEIRDQLWAEAVARYLKFVVDVRVTRTVKASDHPYRWWFERHENVELEEKVTAFRVAADDSAIEDTIRTWWARLAKKPAEFALVEVATNALMISLDRLKRGDEVRIGAILKKIGFDRFRKRENNSLRWVYRPTKELENMTTTKTGTVSTLHALASAPGKP